jgi:hypothetical protein
MAIRGYGLWCRRHSAPGITPDEIPGCHCVALSHPKELADLLVGYTAG